MQMMAELYLRYKYLKIIKVLESALFAHFFVEINRKYIYNISMGKRTYEQVLYEINNARRFGNAPRS